MNGKWEKPRIFPSVNPAQPCFIGFSFSLDVLPPLTYDKIILSIAAVLPFFGAAGYCRPRRQLSRRPAHSSGGTAESGIKAKYFNKCKTRQSL